MRNIYNILYKYPHSFNTYTNIVVQYFHYEQKKWKFPTLNYIRSFFTTGAKGYSKMGGTFIIVHIYSNDKRMGKFIKEATPPPSRRQGCPLENKKERKRKE